MILVRGKARGAMQRIASDEQRCTGRKAPGRASGRPRGDDDHPNWSKSAPIASTTAGEPPVAA
jgi:hypothetical protein